MLGGGGSLGKEGRLKGTTRDSSILGAILDFAGVSEVPKPRATEAEEQNTRHLGRHRP